MTSMPLFHSWSGIDNFLHDCKHKCKKECTLITINSSSRFEQVLVKLVIILHWSIQHGTGLPFCLLGISPPCSCHKEPEQAVCKRPAPNIGSACQTTLFWNQWKINWSERGETIGSRAKAMGPYLGTNQSSSPDKSLIKGQKANHCLYNYFSWIKY